MRKIHHYMFISLLVLGAIAFMGACSKGEIWYITLTAAALGVIIFGYCVASEYALFGKYYKDVCSINEEIIKNYQDIRRILEEQVKLQDSYQRDCDVQRARLITNLMVYREAMSELLDTNNPNNIKYANRWLVKGQEIIDTIDEAYKQNPQIKAEEIFQGLSKLEEEIKAGVVDIHRD